MSMTKGAKNIIHKLLKKNNSLRARTLTLNIVRDYKKSIQNLYLLNMIWQIGIYKNLFEFKIAYMSSYLKYRESSL